MHRQFNSHKEMARRLVFLLYILLFMTFAVELVAALARSRPGDLMVAIGAFFIAALLRHAGCRWLEFERLFESFPAGCVRDIIPESVRMEVESLVLEFHAVGTDWVRRTEIRHRLMELEESQPELAEAYSDDLSQVLAA